MRFALRSSDQRTFPIVVLTLGLFLFVINGLMLWLTSALSDNLGLGFHVRGFWAAFWGAFVVSVVSGLLSLMMRADEHVSTLGAPRERAHQRF